MIFNDGISQLTENSCPLPGHPLEEVVMESVGSLRANGGKFEKKIRFVAQEEEEEAEAEAEAEEEDSEQDEAGSISTGGSWDSLVVLSKETVHSWLKDSDARKLGFELLGLMSQVEDANNKLTISQNTIRQQREEFHALQMKNERNNKRIRGFKNKIREDAHRIMIYEDQISKLENQMDPDSRNQENSQLVWVPTHEYIQLQDDGWKLDIPSDSDSDTEV